MKNLIKILLCAILSVSLFAGCSERSPSSQSDGRLQIVSTIFPSYDFARAIAGENADVSILLAPGVESHSYEPTPQDIIRIQNCDLFLYTGGESDTWVDDLLAPFDEPVNTVKMMDCVEVYEEELLEGMQTEESTGTQETEYDEHVWTSPKNAVLISRAIEKNLCDIDPENAASYQENASAFHRTLRSPFICRAFPPGSQPSRISVGAVGSFTSPSTVSFIKARLQEIVNPAKRIRIPLSK